MTFTPEAPGQTCVDLVHHLQAYGEQAEAMHALFG